MSEVTVLKNEPALVSMIERAAMNPDIDVEKLERLMAMQERILERDAAAEFSKSMALAQSEIGRVSADAKNSQTSSRYATYAQLDRAVRPVYTEHGFALSFGTLDSAPETVLVVCDVMHRGGHTKRYQICMPADGKGAKGNDVMTKTHATGSAMQYGMRYLLKAIFNIAIGDDPDDDDGNAAEGIPLITETQELELDAMIHDNELDRARFMAWLAEHGPETLAEIKANDFLRVREFLLKAIEKKAKK
jgi:hypothetical protein